MNDLSQHLRAMAGRVNIPPFDARILRDASQKLSTGAIPLVIVESPFAGETEEETERNLVYARRAMYDSLMRGEAPMLSHLLYTQVLCDDVPSDRKRGIEAGLAWGKRADKTVVYVDLGVSAGMHLGIDRAKKELRPVIKRSIGLSV